VPAPSCDWRRNAWKTFAKLDYKESEEDSEIPVRIPFFFYAALGSLDTQVEGSDR